MAKLYRLSPSTRLINRVFRAMTQLGVGASYCHILTVPGWKTGRLHSTPVDVMEVGGDRWLVAGYGPANWVRNARAAGEVTLSRGRRTERYRIAEASPAEAVPVLRRYMVEVRVTRPYFDAAPDASDQALEGELQRHPSSGSFLISLEGGHRKHEGRRVCTRYGPPEVLQLRELPTPFPKRDEVRIRVHATAVTSSDCIVRSLRVPASMWIPARLVVGLTKPRRPILGMVLAGESRPSART